MMVRRKKGGGGTDRLGKPSPLDSSKALVPVRIDLMGRIHDTWKPLSMTHRLDIWTYSLFKSRQSASIKHMSTTGSGTFTS